MQEKFNQLKKIILQAEEDMIKFKLKGNKTAGTRLRKSLQDVKEIATDLRREILVSRREKV